MYRPFKILNFPAETEICSIHGAQTIRDTTHCCYSKLALKGNTHSPHNYFHYKAPTLSEQQWNNMGSPNLLHISIGFPRKPKKNINWTHFFQTVHWFSSRYKLPWGCYNSAIYQGKEPLVDCAGVHLDPPRTPPKNRSTASHISLQQPTIILECHGWSPMSSSYVLQNPLFIGLLLHPLTPIEPRKKNLLLPIILVG